MAWNLNRANFAYYVNAGEVGKSSLTSLTFIDPQAWYFLNTGKVEFLEHLKRYLRQGIDPTGGGLLP